MEEILLGVLAGEAECPEVDFSGIDLEGVTQQLGDFGLGETAEQLEVPTFGAELNVEADVETNVDVNIDFGSLMNNSVNRPPFQGANHYANAQTWGRPTTTPAAAVGRLAQGFFKQLNAKPSTPATRPPNYHPQAVSTQPVAQAWVKPEPNITETTASGVAAASSQAWVKPQTGITNTTVTTSNPSSNTRPVKAVVKPATQTVATSRPAASRPVVSATTSSAQVRPMPVAQAWVKPEPEINLTSARKPTLAAAPVQAWVKPPPGTTITTVTTTTTTSASNRPVQARVKPNPPTVTAFRPVTAVNTVSRSVNASTTSSSKSSSKKKVFVEC